MSSSDKKLLILAAKGAGIELSYGKVPYTSFDGLAKGWKDWNPLTNDGDALRLAVKLRIDIQFSFAAIQINCDIYDWAEKAVKVDVQEDGHEDPYAATRRAIVRAAAEIERKKNETQTRRRNTRMG